jgi:glucosamine-6-phosphate deaminase
MTGTKISRLLSDPLKGTSPVSAFKADRLKVYIYKDRKTMGEAACVALEQNVRRLGSWAGIFAAAPSQNDVYASLIENKTFPWHLARALFQMDEYLELPASDPKSFRYYHNTHLWGPALSAGRCIDPAVIKQFEIGPSQQKIKPVRISDDVWVNSETLRYARLLRQFCPDIVQGGLGELNGHIAFNDPPLADFYDPFLVKIIDIAQAAKDQQVAEGHYKTAADIPLAVTLTIPALKSGIKYWSCVVPTARKASAVRRVIFDEVSPAVPGSILRTMDNAALFLDLDAAGELDSGLLKSLR